MLISNFRRVLNVVCFLLGDSPASEFYIPTFRNTLFHLHRQVGACRMNSAGDIFGVLYGKRFGSEMAWAIRTEGDRVGGGSEYRNKLWRVPGPSRVHSTRTYLPMKMEQSVSKRRHIKFRRRRITQKKAYNIVMCLKTKQTVTQSVNDVYSITPTYL